MPIVTKELINLGQQADGTFRVREVHTDTLGVPWKFQYRANSLAEATAIMDARDLTSQLQDRDYEDIREHVSQGFNNHPGTFEYVSPARDITELEAEDEVVTYFAKVIGDEAQPVAWWIQNINNPTFNTIRDRIGYTAGQGTAIRDRATVIITAAPDYNTTIDDPR